LSVIVPSVAGGSGGFVAGTQQVQGSRTALNEHQTPTSNDARAMRIAELMNDYRTLQLHIMEQTSSLSQLGRLSVIVPSVAGGSGGFVAGTQQVQGSRTALNASIYTHI
jgi:hypothetical protein